MCAERRLRSAHQNDCGSLCQGTHGDVARLQALTYNWKGAEGSDAGVFGAVFDLTQRLLHVLSSVACRKKEKASIHKMEVDPRKSFLLWEDELPHQLHKSER